VSHPAEQLRSRLVAHLEDRLRDRGVGGIAVSLGAAPETCAAWLPESLSREPGFLIYSITKTFTGTLALVLQEEGRLSLDDPLAGWFPEVPESEHITIRALLNHTAGVPDYGGLPSYHDAVRRSPGEPWGFEEFAQNSWEKGLLFEPGAGWAYSNPGYMLVKRVLESVADESYPDLLQSRICGPLDLERTFVPESLAALASLAPPRPRSCRRRESRPMSASRTTPVGCHTGSWLPPPRR
jgi:CubicO group peptidase (beta-lactamase class C family)